MLQLRPWKVAIVVFALLFGVVFTLPNLLPRSVTDSLPGWVPAARLNLGLDLQGGSYLLLEVDTVQLKQEKLNNLTEDVRRVLGQQQIAFTGLSASPNAVTVRITDPTRLDAAFKELVKLSAPTVGGGRDLLVTQLPNQTLSLAPPPQADAAAINTAGAVVCPAAPADAHREGRRRLDAVVFPGPVLVRLYRTTAGDDQGHR